MKASRKEYLDSTCHVNLYKGDEKLSGWYVEYYVTQGNKQKYLGMVTVPAPDREHVGHGGRQTTTAANLPQQLYKRKLAGSEIITILYPTYN